MPAPIRRGHCYDHMGLIRKDVEYEIASAGEIFL